MPDIEAVKNRSKGISSAELRADVECACSIQKKRFRYDNISFNSQMKPEHIKKYVPHIIDGYRSKSATRLQNYIAGDQTLQYTEDFLRYFKLHEYRALPYLNEIGCHCDPRAINFLRNTLIVSRPSIVFDCVDNEGNTLLHYAAYHGDSEVLHKLLALGINPNVLNYEGDAPIYWAAIKNQTSSIAQLVAAGADPSSKNANYLQNTPLHYAVSKNNSEAVCALIAAGANPNLANRYGWFPLHSAACYAGKEVIKNLCIGGARHHVVDNIGRTPLQFAVAEINIEAIVALRDAGASQEALAHHDKILVRIAPCIQKGKDILKEHCTMLVRLPLYLMHTGDLGVGIQQIPTY